VIQAVRTAKAIDFDLTAAGQQALTGGGVSTQVLAAMKARVNQKTVHPAPARPTTQRPVAAK